MTCGIYKLNFKNTNKVYIGQSINIETRYNKHISSFKSNSHTKKMQEAYLTYGTPTLEVVLECAPDELDSAELEAFDIWDSINNGFNTSEEPNSTPRLYGELHGRSKYSNEKILHVFNILVDSPELSQSDISSITGVSKSIINDISCGRTHVWLKAAYPDKYQNLSILKAERNSLRKIQAIVRKYPDMKDPNGITYKVVCASKFAREHNLSPSNIFGVLNGTAKSIKGWTLA